MRKYSGSVMLNKGINTIELYTAKGMNWSPSNFVMDYIELTPSDVLEIPANEVTYIEVLYVCQGVHCTYPDKTPIDGTIPIAHPIVVAKRNPNSNTIYSTTDPLEAGTGLDVVEGLCVQRLSIKMEVDGDIIEDGVVF